MNLTGFYNKLREVEATILEAFPVVVSLATPDGGKDGTVTEVTPKIAAKMLVQGLVRLAGEEEARIFRAAQAEAKRIADAAVAAAKVQLTVLTAAEVKKLQDAAAPDKE
ncbi:MAG: hypothetical protein LAQ30_06390 [Acidobacteriia bacterium]|nr:hypothetical protein [Terriglobia bacterium]